jgi:[ribosomal protein S5]-alanine N-acetyltransferase
LAIEFLSGEHVYLRPLTEADVSGPYLKWFNDPEVSAANGHHYRPFTKSEALAYVQRSTPDEIVLAIAARDDDRHVGNVTLKRIDTIAKSAEFAIVIGDKTAWGMGYGKEVGQLLLDHAFLELNLQRIHCGTYETNIGMQKLAAFLGMKEEGRRRSAAFKGNRYLDVIEYGVLRDEYMATRI